MIIKKKDIYVYTAFASFLTLTLTIDVARQQSTINNIGKIITNNMNMKKFLKEFQLQ